MWLDQIMIGFYTLMGYILKITQPIKMLLMFSLVLGMCQKIPAMLNRVLKICSSQAAVIIGLMLSQ